MSKVKKCTQHPSYRAFRRPTSSCQGCLNYYNSIHPDISSAIDMEFMKDDHRQEVKLMTSKNRELLSRLRNLQSFVDGIKALQTTEIGGKILPRKHSKTGSEAVAIMVASDWHIEEEVTSASVNGKNRFNLEIAEARSTLFFQNCLNLLKKEQQAAEIHTIVLALLGDFFTGYIHEENREVNLLPPVLAMVTVMPWIERGINLLLNHTKCQIVVPCCYGNHGRITDKKRYSNLRGTSLELALYTFLARLYANEPRIKFEIAEGYHLYLNVLGYNLRFHHGDATTFHGGIGGITIPINKSIAMWNTAETPYMDIMGHWHQITDGNNFYVNGSLIGYTALSIGRYKAPYQPPKQGFFLIDRDRGRTINAPVILTDIRHHKR